MLNLQMYFLQTWYLNSPSTSGFNNYAIKLVDGQQQPYEPIYSLRLIELKTLKVYIEINLANGFIRLFKSPAYTSILFNRKSDGFF